MIDRSDRHTIRAVINLMNLVWKEDWYETDFFITIPAWGRRFWFATEDGVEFIERIETFERIML